MNVTFMLMYHYPEKVSSYHLYNDLMEHLRNSGHFVHVITPNPVRGINHELRKLYKTEKQIETEFENQLVKRINVPFDTSSGLIRRALRYLLLSIRCSNALKKVKTDVLYIQSDPPILYAYFVSKVCQKMKIPFVYNIQDAAPDNMNKLKKSGLIYKLLDSVHKKALNRANQITVISEDIKDLIVRKGIDPNKIKVISNWKYENTSSLAPTFNHPILESKQFQVVYAGNIGYVQNMDIILNAATLVRDPDIAFSIIGDGVRKDWLIGTIKERNLNNVSVYDKVSVDEVDAIYKKADVNLITLNKGIIYTAMPSKTSSCIDAKKPIVVSCDLDSKYASFITFHNIGVVVDPNDANGLSKAITQIKNQTLTFKEDGFIKAHKAFDKTTNVEEYMKLFSQLFNQNEVNK